MEYREFSRTMRRARKEHRCIWCGQRIRIGDTYSDERSIFDGRVQRHRWHPECEKAASDYFEAQGDGEFTPGENERPVRTVRKITENKA